MNHNTENTNFEKKNYWNHEVLYILPTPQILNTAYI